MKIAVLFGSFNPMTKAHISAMKTAVKAIDELITNFHLSESTLLMLVSALAGKDFIMRAYEEAVVAKYRFFSFGDAMLIV